jgi:DNA-binding NarL/FixJ family response regulator
VALLQIHDALFNRGDLARADELVVEASGKVEERGWRDQLDATRALTAGLRGDLRGALAISEPLRRREDVEPRVLLGVLTVSTVAHTLLGDLVAARHDVCRAVPLLEPLQAALPLAGDQIRIIEVGGELYDGRVSAAVALADKGYELALEAGMAGQVGSWAVTLAMTLVSAGRLTDALRLTDAALANLEVADPLALRATALCFRVLCAAALRDEPEPSAAILEQLQASGERDVRVRIHAGRAQVWLTAARGDLEGASRLAVEHGRWAVGASHDVWGAMTLHDAVRFGHPELVEADLAALASAHNAELLQLFADHAMALNSQDPDALRDVAARYSAGGAELYAAEAMAQAADELHRQGQQRAADTATTAASELLSRTNQAITPALLHAQDPLTNREREIAIMARRGMSSREIAETLVLSPRTVDNHLAAVYRKAGIDGRHQLHDLGLGEEPDSAT